MGKEVAYHGEPSASEFSNIVRERVKNYDKYFTRLKKNNIPFSPYLDIGAGVGQAAMLLENKYGATGIATDISLETLAIADKYAKELKFKKMPMRIACDAYNLPIRSGSIPFVFTFQTLHHFPNPLPLLHEIKRVISPEGYFYFHEEPVKQNLNANLWKRGYHLRWFEKILKMLIVLHFISSIGKNETEHNILEETFTLKTWEKALDVFPNIQANIFIYPFEKGLARKKTKQAGWLKPPLVQRILLGILGGGIEALCQKEFKALDIEDAPRGTRDILNLLACPQCKHKPKLYFQKKQKKLYCPTCNTSYKNRQGVYLLFSKKQMKKLYPNL